MTFYFGVLRNRCVSPWADVSSSGRCCLGCLAPGQVSTELLAPSTSRGHEPLARLCGAGSGGLSPAGSSCHPKPPAGHRWQQGGNTTETRDSRAVMGPLPDRATGQGTPGCAHCAIPRVGACLSWEGATTKGSPGLPQPLR